MPVQPLFVADAEARDLAYINLRAATDGPGKHARDFTEALWDRFAGDADPHFAVEIRNAFDERFWEMALTCALRDHGLEASCPKPGPDNLVTVGDTRIWLEAICPTPGAVDHPDRVPDYRPGAPIAYEVPDRELILRLRAAIEEKYRRKYPDYLDKGIVAPNEPFVIAINGCQLPHAMAESEPPRIVKSVFPIGGLQVSIDKKTMEIVETKYVYRPSLRKASSAEVATDIFLDQEYSALSAVLYSRVDAGNPPAVLGEDFVLVHNPLARNPLPEDFLKVGCEFKAIADGDEYRVEFKQW